LAHFERASTFFAERINEGARVWMKLNCEGAEVAILRDLITSGESRKLHEVLIDFDAAKIPSIREQVDDVLTLLGSVPFAFSFPEEVQYGMINNYGGIHHWLRRTGALERTPAAMGRSIAYQAKQALNPLYSGYYKIHVLRALRLAPPAPLRRSPLRDQIGHGRSS
jgi:hypothetical protein